MLRRTRSRFGMSARRVTVRPHIPWYWLVLATVVLLAVAIVVAGWVYDGSRRFAAYDKTAAEHELNALHERVNALEAEAQQLRGIGNASDASLQIERTAQQKLGEEVKKLEEENSRLREDLAAFENLASGEEKNETIGIHRLQVEPDAINAGSYHYRMLLAAPVSRTEREFKGRLQLVAMFQQDGKAVIVNIPDAVSTDAQKFLINFKYFRRAEGTFTLPVHGVLKRIEVRLMQGATLVASQQLTM